MKKIFTNRPYFIAEIGVNHNGKLKKAKKLIDVAKRAGADAVKFQTFTADKLADKNTKKVNYQKINTDKKENHYQMLKKLELIKDNQLRIGGLFFMITGFIIIYFKMN